ncbi:MAG: hypothetical protein WCO55_02485 [Candidatus Falkowbacteria bacterium]
MFKYLEDYNLLPQVLRDRLSQPSVVSAIQNLEFKYHLQLASLIMRIMTKEINIADLIPTLISEMKLAPDRARELAADLKHTIFFSVSDYVYGDKPAAAYTETPKVTDSAVPEAGRNNFISIPKSIASAVLVPEPSGDADEKANEILKASGILFGSRELNERLRKIVATGLKGIRNNTELKETLTKPIEAGGLDFDADLADKLLAMIDQPKPSIAKPFDLGQAMQSAGVERDVAYDFNQLAKTGGRSIEPELPAGPLPAIEGELEAIFPMHAKAIPTAANNSNPNKTLASTGAAKAPRSSVDIAWPKTLAKEVGPAHIKASDNFGAKLIDSLSGLPKVDLAAATPPLAAPSVVHTAYDLSQAADPANRINPFMAGAPTSANLPKSDSGKVAMNDVKGRPRIFSPIDELSFMTIKNFRQLSKDPQVSIDLIMRKVQAIVQDDFQKKIEAINAWKQSPVNRMYVRVLKDALDSGSSAGKALVKFKKDDPDFLTDAEFEAIIKLNQELSTYR